MSKVAKRDRALIGLPDVLLSSMRSFNCVIKCNMQIDLNNFYDPELNGCFKGRHCHFLHEHFAPQGATRTWWW